MPQPPESGNSVIATFYSYKGGTGRSMALANIACLLGLNLQETGKVLAIDWDLEAPGLHRYFPKSSEEEQGERPGLIDYFCDLARLLDEGGYEEFTSEEGWRRLEEALPLSNYVIRDVANGVDLMKAGSLGTTYRNLVLSFNWKVFFERYHRIFSAFRAQLASRYRWCLIDSRTGISDISGICTMVMPEKLVAVFTPNVQSIGGLLDMLAEAVKYRCGSDDPRPLSIFPLPSRTITVEPRLMQESRAYYTGEFENCLREAYALESIDLAGYFDEVEIPHENFYGFRERVAVRDDPFATSALSINRAYQRFYERLVKQDCAWESVMGDPAKYLETLRRETAFIDIRGLQVGTGKAYRFPIEDLYIPLTTAAEPGKRAELDVREPVGIEGALKHPRLVIAGDPGAGKTTFLRHIASRMCEDLVRGNAGRFPILIRIAELAEHVRACRRRREGPTVAAAPGWLPHWLAAKSAEFGWGLNSAFFERKLRDGEAAVLLDGLDEAPGRTERESMARLLENATQAYEKCSFVVTTRPLAYQGESVLADFQTANIAPLEAQAIDTFLERWCGVLFSENPASAATHLAELSGALRVRAEIRQMARNPVMLTALAVVHWNERRLPEQRADLYESILTWLARSREQRPERPSPERCLMLLQQLALAMQNLLQGRAVQVSKGWAAGTLAPHFREVAEPERLSRALAFLEQEEVDSGIIVSRAADVGFRHLTFQEYMAAKAAAGMADAAQQELLLATDRTYRPEWREVVLLLGGVLYRQGLEKVDGLISAILGKLGARPPLARQARCAGLLGAMVRDLRPFHYQPVDPRYQRTMAAVLNIFDADKAYDVEFPVRLEAAEALGQAGDPRLRQDTWITIDGGGPASLKSFQIGRYPVPVEEYRRFVEDDGYQNERWWIAGGFGETSEPGNWDEQLQHPNWPVTRVSWYEAAAYCAWVGVRLPSESEWDLAARGHVRREYPWGNEPPDERRANFHMKVGNPTPVGLYPAGATPEGVADMAGNVWEWVEDWYERHRMRVLRGGSFSVVASNLRAADRDRYGPGSRGDDIGFRCARDVAP
jgi:cellulose biosynthesis protein BcsQ